MESMWRGVFGYKRENGKDSLQRHITMEPCTHTVQLSGDTPASDWSHIEAGAVVERGKAVEVERPIFFLENRPSGLRSDQKHTLLVPTHGKERQGTARRSMARRRTARQNVLQRFQQSCFYGETFQRQTV